MERTRSAEAAVSSPPSCLAGFHLRCLPLAEGDLALAVDFALGCKSCGGSAFKIYGFPSADEAFFAPPHRLQCVACNNEAPLFDARTQGYDGVLNGGCAYESGGPEETAVPGQFSVVVGVLYNIALEELIELSQAAKVSPSDLFDCIDIVANPIGGGEKIAFSYECA